MHKNKNELRWTRDTVPVLYFGTDRVMNLRDLIFSQSQSSDGPSHSPVEPIPVSERASVAVTSSHESKTLKLVVIAVFSAGCPCPYADVCCVSNRKEENEETSRNKGRNVRRRMMSEFAEAPRVTVRSASARLPR